jgi:hypothetical protein
MKSSRMTGFAVLCVAFGALNVTGQYSVTMPYKTVTVENVNGIASFSGAFPYGEAGQPKLPAYKVSFLLPPDADFKDVTVSLDGVSENMLSETYMVNPMVVPSPEYIAKKGLNLKDGKDMKIYGKNEFYPADYKGQVFFGFKGQYKIVDVAIYPYRYNPQTNKLRTITAGTLAVTISNSRASAQMLNMARNERYEQSLKTHLANPSELEQYGAWPAQTPNFQAVAPQGGTVMPSSLGGIYYMIITTNNVVYNSKKLGSYIASLQNRGAYVTTITEDQLGSSVGQTKADAIRSYLYSAWTVGLVNNVVLIGNSDPVDGDVPMAQDSLTWGIATDYYYADIVGAFPDGYAELNVGRIPVLPSQPASIDSLDTILAKDSIYAAQTGDNAKW